MNDINEMELYRKIRITLMKIKKAPTEKKYKQLQYQLKKLYKELENVQKKKRESPPEEKPIPFPIKIEEETKE